MHHDADPNWQHKRAAPRKAPGSPPADRRQRPLDAEHRTARALPASFMSIETASAPNARSSSSRWATRRASRTSASTMTAASRPFARIESSPCWSNTPQATRRACTPRPPSTRSCRTFRSPAPSTASPTTAARSKRTWTVDLNAYTCTLSREADPRRQGIQAGPARFRLRSRREGDPDQPAQRCRMESRAARLPLRSA